MEMAWLIITVLFHRKLWLLFMILLIIYVLICCNGYLFYSRICHDPNLQKVVERNMNIKSFNASRDLNECTFRFSLLSFVGTNHTYISNFMHVWKAHRCSKVIMQFQIKTKNAVYFIVSFASGLSDCVRPWVSIWGFFPAVNIK